MKFCCQMLALLLLEVNWISVILCTPKLVSTQLDSYFCIIEERVLPEGYNDSVNSANILHARVTANPVPKAPKTKMMNAIM